MTAGAAVMGNCGEEARRWRIRPPLRPHAHGAPPTATSSDFDGYGGAVMSGASANKNLTYAIDCEDVDVESKFCCHTKLIYSVRIPSI